MKIFTRVAGISVALLLLPSCGHHKPSRTSAGQWAPYISGYTSGLISHESTIIVRMTNEAARDNELNKPLKQCPFSFSPSIKGTAFFKDRSTIEFRPDRRLKDKQNYKASFDLSRFIKVPKQCAAFPFEFSAMEQMIDMRVDGLAPMKSDDCRWQRLSGTLITADVEDAGAVEKTLEIRRESKTLAIRWEHAEDRCRHSFTIDSIERREKPSAVELSWNGSGINARQQSSQQVNIPAIDDFSVLEAKCIPGGEQRIIIRFSDPLERNQNLAGIIQVPGDDNPRCAIENNEIHIYPSTHLAGTIDIAVNPGVRNIAGKKYKETTAVRVTIESIKPQVRFAGKGVIIPTSANAVIPIEAVNLKAIDVRAIRIYRNNIPQFLQVNDLAGAQELTRVGSAVWHKIVPINFTADMRDRWVHCGFDLSPLLSAEPNALYRIELRFSKKYAAYPCSGADTAIDNSDDNTWTLEEEEGGSDDSYEDSYNYYNEYEGDNGENSWQRRDDPCSNRYYLQYGGTFYSPAAARNVLISDIGLIAKIGGPDTMFITTTNIKTAQPYTGVNVKVLNYQYRIIGEAVSDGSGLCSAPLRGKPYLVTAESGKQCGYLRVDEGSALQISHFDVGGASVPKGLKGFLYGERGVWRPGDSLFLTFVLEDKTHRLPKDHPVTLELINPRGQTIQTITRTTSIDHFYSFATATPPDAPTGVYNARVKVGGAVFESGLKIETVMPNRLKVNLDFGSDTIFIDRKAASGKLSTRWLSGAVAHDLKADVELRLEPAATTFSKFKEYRFDDPVRQFGFEPQMIFEGKVDAGGSASISLPATESNPQGMLSATFKSRVFEPGGAFSVDRRTMPFSPFSRYIGIKLPKPDVPWGAFCTDSQHSVSIATVSAHGIPVAVKNIRLQLFKVDWRWWWEQGDRNLADFIASPEHKPVASAVISTVNGLATWSFSVSHNNWGRYLLRAQDLDGGHATGEFLYVDWADGYPRGASEAPGGASVLSFTSDKNEYTVGEKAMLTIPGGGASAQILISIENGSTVQKQFWVRGSAKQTSVPIDITGDMAPTAYVYATLLQPHGQTQNDLPIRMYGVIALRVVDPATKLSPTLTAPDVLRPGEKALVKVSESKGRPMAYTLAVVDEGLLDLTRFKTPDLWNFFYQREALGVRTWDLFDLVSGAYGAQLERILSIGGDQGLSAPGQKRGNRFPPMVRFIGPCRLKAGETAEHHIDVPQYVGSVRVMVVAGENGAYGSAERAVAVRNPLMVLATLPRVLGPSETTRLPVSVFAMEKHVHNVQVTVSVSGKARLAGAATKSLTFKEPGDELVAFDLTALPATGQAHVLIEASGNGEKARQDIDIEIRNPNLPVVSVIDTLLAAGRQWRCAYTLPGIEGTNSALVEISRMTPLDLGKRLEYLISYPHGCVEQTTSAVFPQLFLSALVDLPAERKHEIQQNVQAGIIRMQSFQCGSGGFSYWPGYGDADAWASSYAGHFLTEAKLAGYSLPDGLQERWIRFQQRAANEWNGSEGWARLTQSYRLYTLALAQKPELGAMNRLREFPKLEIAARWRLAAAYQLAGQHDIAMALIANVPGTVEPYRELGQTFGSDLRDNAMILETMTLCKDQTNAARLAQKIGEQVGSSQWMSTQTTAYALLALSKFLGSSGTSGTINCSLHPQGEKELSLVTSAAVLQQKLAIGPNMLQGTLDVTNHATTGVAYVRLILKGTPLAGHESIVNQGISMQVEYETKNGQPLNPLAVEQGTDFIATVTLTAPPAAGSIDRVALTQVFPSGWEIRNMRFEQLSEKESGYEYRDIRDDRVFTYCSLSPQSVNHYRIELNAAYVGKYYLPAIYASAMYDETINAVVPGKWVEVKEPVK
jgi:hypothetical protein